MWNKKNKPQTKQTGLCFLLSRLELQIHLKNNNNNIDGRGTLYTRGQ